MNKQVKFLIIIALIILIFSLCFLNIGYASTVTRSFDGNTIHPNQELTVFLLVDIPTGETYYAIDEFIPTNWNIIDPGTGSTEHEGHIKWVVIQDAVNTFYTYTIISPDKIGTSDFNGIYMFEDMNDIAYIKGKSQISIIETEPEPEIPINPLTIAIVMVIIVAILIIIMLAKLMPGNKEPALAGA